MRDYLEFGKIDALIHDTSLEDISCNGVDIPIFLYHKNYENIMTNITFDEKQLDSFVIRLAQRCGKHISIAEPMIDATMPDGSRIQMTLGKEITTRGSTFTIRKFKEDPFTPVDLIAWNTFSSETMAYLWLCIENNQSLIFSGGTASGKTSSLNAVSLFIPQPSKVISLEDTRELMLYHATGSRGDPRLVTGQLHRDRMFDLLRAALRQRPEYLLVGEVRGKEALTLFQAMYTGHTTFSTMHADSIQAVVNRLLNEPINVPNMMLQSLNIVSIQELVYLNGQKLRRTRSVVEITGIDPRTNNLRINELYRWNSLDDTYEPMGESVVLSDIMSRRGWDRARLKREIADRIRVLEYLRDRGIRDYRRVTIAINAYYVMPDKVLEMIGSDEFAKMIESDSGR